MLRPKLLILSLAASSSLSYAEDNPDYYATPFQAPELIPSQMDFGGVGLMQMPTGRMAKEGEMTLGYSKNDAYTFYTISLQLLPWLESTIRYTQVAGVLYSEDASFSGDTNYTDKGIDLKVRLLEESRFQAKVHIVWLKAFSILAQKCIKSKLPWLNPMLSLPLRERNNDSALCFFYCYVATYLQ